MQRPLEQRRGGRDLDERAEIHHRHPVAHEPDDAQVVGDEEVGQTEPLAQVDEEVQDLRRTETSSADTASSATISRGPTASARAIPTRWR